VATLAIFIRRPDCFAGEFVSGAFAADGESTLNLTWQTRSTTVASSGRGRETGLLKTQQSPSYRFRRDKALRRQSVARATKVCKVRTGFGVGIFTGKIGCSSESHCTALPQRPPDKAAGGRQRAVGQTQRSPREGRCLSKSGNQCLCVRKSCAPCSMSIQRHPSVRPSR
jgi:hypothetical protein